MVVCKPCNAGLRNRFGTGRSASHSARARVGLCAGCSEESRTDSNFN
jgi:hypothetical protein